MKKVSDKRAIELRHYDRVKKELEKELKESGNWFCFFSGIPLPDHLSYKDVSWHHLNKRDNEMLIEKEFLVPVLDRYHTQDEGYHNHPISELKTFWWWDGFMSRLEKKHHDLWMKIKYKQIEYE